MDKYRELEALAGDLDWAYAGTLTALLAERDALLEALERLMVWQVRNVDKWDNPAYDHAAAIVEFVKGEENGDVNAG